MGVCGPSQDIGNQFTVWAENLSVSVHLCDLRVFRKELRVQRFGTFRNSEIPSFHRPWVPVIVRTVAVKRSPRSVIPAQAGIQGSELRDHPPAPVIIELRGIREGEVPSVQAGVGLIGTNLKHFWIPACAGMTIRGRY